MSEFLEERLAAQVRMGARYADEYQVEVFDTAAGAEYRRLVHPYPRRRFRLATLAATADLWTKLLDLYHRAYGKYAGFRVRCVDDFSTNGNTGTPTATDQTLALISTGVYQLQKSYGPGGTPASIGRPVRKLYKPVANTTKVAIAGIEIPSSGWTVSTTNGRVTFGTNNSKSITGITQAASAVVTVGAHTYVTGQSVYFSGVVGMTQINGLRGLITATGGTTITVAIDSSAFTAYSSAGACQTNPGAGEAVTGGCQFDIPVRFDTAIEIDQDFPDHRQVQDVELVELLNP